MYVDVHTHLTHEKFAGDEEAVIERAKTAGLGAIVVNGLEPVSNRRILAMAQAHPVVKPAMGIYPVDAVHDLLPEDFPLPVPAFDIDQEIAAIREKALAGELIAVGECGLDGYWLPEETFSRQEEVFEQLVGVAMEANLPVIIHTRKREKRASEILDHLGAKNVDFHCFGGKVKLAKRCAEDHGWWFSIPANARTNEAFTKMLRELPEERLLTETDAPYLSPQKGERNEPANVVETIALLAELRGWEVDQARNKVWQNYQDLFAPNRKT